MNMLVGSRRGTKPSKWRKSASKDFKSYFAQRSEPLNSLPEEEPLAEVTGAGFKWLFRQFGEEPTQVRAAAGGAVRNVALGVTGALLALGSGQCPGEGTCEQYWVGADGLEVPHGTAQAVPRIRGGTGDLQLRLESGETLLCSSHHYRPHQRSDDEPELMQGSDEVHHDIAGLGRQVRRRPQCAPRQQ